MALIVLVAEIMISRLAGHSGTEIANHSYFFAGISRDVYFSNMNNYQRTGIKNDYGL